MNSVNFETHFTLLVCSNVYLSGQKSSRKVVFANIQLYNTAYIVHNWFVEFPISYSIKKVYKINCTYIRKGEWLNCYVSEWNEECFIINSSCSTQLSLIFVLRKFYSCWCENARDLFAAMALTLLYNVFFFKIVIIRNFIFAKKIWFDFIMCVDLSFLSKYLIYS